MLWGIYAATGLAVILFVWAVTSLAGIWGLVLDGVFGLLSVAGLFGAVTMTRLYKAFSYEGKTRLSERIIEGTASYVTIPAGGTGLDVGCGSGALTIACAKRNPEAKMVVWIAGGSSIRHLAKRFVRRTPRRKELQRRSSFARATPENYPLKTRRLTQ